MEVSILSQAILILYSIIFGAFLALIYDFIRILRVLLGIKYINKRTNFENVKLPIIKAPFSLKKGVLKEKIILSVTDILYFLLITPISMIFVYQFNNGKFRWYVFFGMIIGFVIYYFTIGKIVISFSEYIVFAIRVVFSYVIYFITRPFLKIFLVIKSKIVVKLEKIKKEREIKKNEKVVEKRKGNSILSWGK